MDDSHILKDAKELLRATLVSKQHGVQQSKLEQEYKQLTVGEQLPWRKLGFANLYEFLVSVPDVAKLEWRVEDQDNRVFAVLNEATYASLHAKKMSVKGFGIGTKPLSPEEIKQWKQAHGSSTSETDVSDKSKGRKKRNKKNKNTISKTNHSQQPVSNKSLVNHRDSLANEVYKMVTENNPEVLHNSERKDTCDKYKDILPNFNGLYSVCIKLLPKQDVKISKVEAIKLVEHLFNLPSCKVVESSAVSNTLLFVRYRTLRELVLAVDTLHNYQIGFIRFDVSPAKDRTVVRSTTNTNDVTKLTQPVGNGLLQFYSNPQQLLIPTLPLQQGLLPTPSLLPNILPTHSVTHQHAPTVTHNPLIDQTDPIQHGANATNKQSSPPDNQNDGDNVSNKDSTKVAEKADGRFTVSENEFVEMCLTGTKQRPKLPIDFPDQIKFIITHAEDPCQFWIHLLEQNVAITELMTQLQDEISKVPLNTGPKQCPSIHQFGAAKYHEDGLWYRCWVIDVNREKEQIRVFYCDYGNDEVVSIENFKEITTSRWSLLPQATPVKLHGAKLISKPQGEKKEEGVLKLSSLCFGELLQADVVKDLRNAKSHIIELRNVVLPGYNDGYLLDIMAELGFLEREDNTSHSLHVNGAFNEASNGIRETTEVKETVEVDSRPVNILEKDGIDIEHGQNGSSYSKVVTRFPCYYDIQKDLDSNNTFVSGNELECLQLCHGVFEINPRNVIKIKICSVQSPKLFYVKTESSSGLERKIKALLAKSQAKEKANPTIGSMAGFCNVNAKLRVEVLDLACNFTYSKKVLVIDIDSGKRIWANADDLYELSEDLMMLPGVVGKAALAGVTTRTLVTGVTPLLEEFSGKEIFAHIVGKDATSIFHVELFQDIHSKSINVGVVLENLANVVSSDPFGVPRQEKGRWSKKMSKKKRKSKKKTAEIPNGQTSRLKPGGQILSDSSFLSVSSRSWSDRSSVSSESAVSEESFSSSGVVYKPHPVIVSSKKFGEKDIYHADRNVFGKDGEQHLSNNKTWTTRQDHTQDVLRKKNRNMQPSIANPLQDNSVEFSTIPVKRFESDDLEITAVRYSTNPVGSTVAHSAQRKQKFRPHTPPVPDDRDKKDSNEAGKYTCNHATVEELISSVRDLQKDHVVTNLINIDNEGVLNRDLIELEIKRWEIEKERLQNYIHTLKEALGSSKETSGMILSKNRKKRLELHVNILSAEKQLEDVTKELNDLNMGWF